MSTSEESVYCLGEYQKGRKRAFDIAVSSIGLLLTIVIIFLAWTLVSLETFSNGFFFQKRVGLNGKLFSVIKIKTMQQASSSDVTVTTEDDPRITVTGRFFRKTKIDELPQLWNVLVGNMSMVGPRPDVPGFADRLTGPDRAILFIRPGITGPASLKYRDEGILLASQDDPVAYNRDVIWPDKVRINLEYIREWSIRKDVWYLLKTVFN